MTADVQRNRPRATAGSGRAHVRTQFAELRGRVSLIMRKIDVHEELWCESLHQAFPNSSGRREQVSTAPAFVQRQRYASLRPRETAAPFGTLAFKICEGQSSMFM